MFNNIKNNLILTYKCIDTLILSGASNASNLHSVFRYLYTVF